MGYSSVSPYLMVSSVEEELQFLNEVFGAVTKETLKRKDGIIQHGEATIGDTVIMIGKSRPEWPSTQSASYVFVKNADETYAKALQLGAITVLEPADRFYGYREGGVKDKQGNTWWLAQVLEELTEAEMQKRSSGVF